jgi:hypothetical protein
VQAPAPVVVASTGGGGCGGGGGASGGGGSGVTGGGGRREHAQLVHGAEPLGGGPRLAREARRLGQMRGESLPIRPSESCLTRHRMSFPFILTKRKITARG